MATTFPFREVSGDFVLLDSAEKFFSRLCRISREQSEQRVAVTACQLLTAASCQLPSSNRGCAVPTTVPLPAIPRVSASASLYLQEQHMLASFPSPTTLPAVRLANPRPPSVVPRLLLFHAPANVKRPSIVTWLQSPTTHGAHLHKPRRSLRHNRYQRATLKPQR